MDLQDKIYSVSFGYNNKYITCGTAGVGPLPVFEVTVAGLLAILNAHHQLDLLNSIQNN